MPELLAPETVARPVQVEIVQEFDLGTVPAGLRDSLHEDTQAIRKEMESTAQALYRIGAIVSKWHEALGDYHGAYTAWINYCFEKSASYARVCEAVYTKFCNGNAQLLRAFDFNSLQILCAPSVPSEVFDSALALAQKGQQVTKARAQLLKKGVAVMTVAEGDQVAVCNPMSPAYSADKPLAGKVYATDPKHGQIDIQDGEGKLHRLTLWELNAPAPLPKKEEKPTTPPALPPVQGVDAVRLAGVEEVLQKLIEAALQATPLMPLGSERVKLELAIVAAQEFF